MFCKSPPPRVDRDTKIIEAAGREKTDRAGKAAREAKIKHNLFGAMDSSSVAGDGAAKNKIAGSTLDVDEKLSFTSH